ncbi:hypothetical protein HYS93_03165 [Candidatus Daviesbacteria bacterium]|nr:hypothetical protein [Candidatus Daviesbacteria bacterium]
MAERNGDGTLKFKYGYHDGVRGGLPRNVIFKPDRFPAQPRHGADPSEIALEVLEDPATLVLSDMSRGGFNIYATQLRPGVAEIYTEAGISVVELNGQKPAGVTDRVDTPEQLLALAKRTVVVLDHTGDIQIWKTQAPQLAEQVSDVILLSREVKVNGGGKPQTIPPRVDAPPSAYKRIIEVEADTNRYIFSERGEALGHAAIDSKRGAQNVADRLEKIKKGEARTIRLPDTSTGTTTLDQEVRFFKSDREKQLEGYAAKRERTPESTVLGVILSRRSVEGVEVSDKARADLEDRIRPWMKRNLPPLVSLSIAIGTRIQNELKARESLDLKNNLPTAGWLHFGNWIETLNRKIQTVYEPGIQVVVFDEATLFAELMGIDPKSVEQHLAATRRLLAAVGAPIEIIPMTKEMFPQTEVDKMISQVQTEFDERGIHTQEARDKIFSIVCARPEMTDPEVMDLLYSEGARKARREEFRAGLRGRIGAELWDDSRRIAIEIAKHLAYRKQAGLFNQLVRDHSSRFNGVDEVAVDATVTDKDERVVFDITSVLFNHATAVVKRDSQGLHSVNIVPEYRVNREHPGAKPVRIDRAELLPGLSGSMTFLYEVR